MTGYRDCVRHVATGFRTHGRRWSISAFDQEWILTLLLGYPVGAALGTGLKTVKTLISSVLPAGEVSSTPLYWHSGCMAKE
jgi:hypothetical protein